MQPPDLMHHFFIDVQASGCVNNYHVDMLLPRMCDGVIGDVNRILFGCAGKKRGLDLPCQGFQLIDSCRPVDITTGQQYRFLVTLGQQARKLGAAGGLARALQSGHQDNGRRLDTEIKRVIGIPHDVYQLVIDDLHQRLARCQALHHLLSRGPFAHPRDKILDHWQRHIGLQQCHAHITQGVTDIVLGHAPLATQVANGL